MATDILTLGSIAFSEWNTPSKIPFGGSQQMAIHRLPGGNRVIDTVGPDENDIVFHGIQYGNDAMIASEALDAMRLSGAQFPLSFAGRFYIVIVAECHVNVVRFPLLTQYTVRCVVTQNLMAGNLGAIPSTTSQLVTADMATAMSISDPSTTPLPGSGSGGIGSA